MADRYWVGGTGTWNSTSTTKWSATSGGSGGASVPTSLDNVFIDANSGTGSFTITVPIADTISCFSLKVTRSNLTIEAFGADFYIGDTGGATGSGKIEFSGAGTTGSGVANGRIYLRGGSSSSTVLIGLTGTSIPSANIYVIQGSVTVTTQIQAVYTDFYVQSGATLNLAGNTSFFISRLQVDSGATIDVTSARLVVDDWEGNGTITGASSVTMEVPAYSGGGTFRGTAAVTYGTVKFENDVFIYGNQTFNTFNYNFYAKMEVEGGRTITVLTAVNFDGPFFSTNATLSSISGTGTFTLSKASGTVALPYLVISGCNATGGATFTANTTSVDAGNNTGIQFANSRGLFAFFG